MLQIATQRIWIQHFLMKHAPSPLGGSCLQRAQHLPRLSYDPVNTDTKGTELSVRIMEVSLIAEIKRRYILSRRDRYYMNFRLLRTKWTVLNREVSVRRGSTILQTCIHVRLYVFILPLVRSFFTLYLHGMDLPSCVTWTKTSREISKHDMPRDWSMQRSGDLEPK